MTIKMAERAIVFERITSDMNQTRHFIRYINANWKRGLTSKDTQSPVKQRGDRLKARRRETRFSGYLIARDEYDLTCVMRNTNILLNERKQRYGKKEGITYWLDSRFSGFGLLCLRRDILCVLPSPNQRRHA